MKKRVVVLGCGLVGAVIARDLAAQDDLDVLVADRDKEALARLQSLARVQARRADLSQPLEIRDLAAEADVVVGALPGRYGAAMLRAVLEAGRPLADISFSPEDPLSFDALARERGVAAIVDCGVSPGLSNFAVGRAAARLDRVDDVTILVGGLPVDRQRPYEYAIVFSATDVIEEYTRPARVVENGRIVTRPALSEVESVEVPGVGTMEAFLTDGLRTLLSTVRAQSMREKTVRYPGHAEKMRLLRDTGFFQEEPIEIGRTKIAPRAVTERLLFRAWKLGPEEKEFTWLRVAVTGVKGERSFRFSFELSDRTDEATGTTSMARTTGFPCAIVAAMLARGEFRQPGVSAPEALALDEKASAVLLAGLKARGIAWTEREEQP